jgi:hypothetical protein
MLSSSRELHSESDGFESKNLEALNVTSKNERNTSRNCREDLSAQERESVAITGVSGCHISGSFSAREPWFSPATNHMGFVVGNVTVWRNFLWARFSSTDSYQPTISRSYLPLGVGSRGSREVAASIDSILPHSYKISRGSIVIEALCYKPEGREFETRWGERIIQFA